MGIYRGLDNRFLSYGGSIADFVGALDLEWTTPLQRYAIVSITKTGEIAEGPYFLIGDDWWSFIYATRLKRTCADIIIIARTGACVDHIKGKKV